MDQKYLSIINGPKLEECEKRKCEKGEVCVEVHSVPVNPIDAFKLGASEEQLKALPPTSGVGFDAIGKIVDSNVDNNSDIVGKLVAVYQTFFSSTFSGTWRQYIYCPLSDVFVLPDHWNTHKFWHYVGNPLAACGLYDNIRKYKAKTIIQNAAWSAVGWMIYKYAAKKGIEVINIVRSEDQVKMLENLGAEHIINSSSDRFNENLKEIVDNLKPTVFLDAIGNRESGKLIKMLPNGATTIIYGTLDPEELGLTSADILFSAKTILPFGCPFWLMNLDDTERNMWVNEIMEDFENGGEVFGTPIYNTYPLKEFKVALEDYPNFRSFGKLVINMNDDS